jgi:anti-sigma B factor antagonist
LDVDQFSIKRSDDAEGVVLALSGELDAVSAPVLKRCLSELATDSRARVVLDLSELSFVDSPGINVLLAAKKAAQDEGRLLILRRPTAQVQSVFAVLALSEWLTLEDP